MAAQVRRGQRYRRDLAAFSTWLFTIARRVAVDHYRRHRATEPFEALTQLTYAETTEDLAEAHADLARLTVLLARLADRDAGNHFLVVNEWHAGSSAAQDYARDVIVAVTVHGQPGVLT